MTDPAGTAMAERTGPSGRRGWKERLRHLAHIVLEPVVRLLAFARFGPDHLTIIGLLTSMVSAIMFFEGHFRVGGMLLAAAGVCDILDGELARRRGSSSRFGAFLDSTLDRISESLVLTGIAGFYLVHLVELSLDPGLVLLDLERGLEPRTWAVVSLTAMLAMVGSFMVSYTRARAEGLGLECKVGWFERPERLVLLIVASAFGVGRIMSLALIILAVFSFVTVGQRIVHVWKITRGAGRDADNT